MDMLQRSAASNERPSDSNNEQIQSSRSPPLWWFVPVDPAPIEKTLEAITNPHQVAFCIFNRPVCDQLDPHSERKNTRCTQNESKKEKKRERLRDR